VTAVVSDPVSTRPAERPPGGLHIPGEAGTWIFIFGDMCVFSVFFAYYLVSRGDDPVLFEQSQDMLNRNFGALNTIVLLVSSLLVVLAVKAMRATRRDLAQRLVVGAFLCGITFVVVKVLEYHERIAAGQTPMANDFYLLYFLLTGLHLFHLVLGLGVLTSLWVLAGKARLSAHQWAYFEGGTCFWHMVDLLWIVLFPLLFLVR